MNTKQKAKWEATRAKGKRRYIVLVGIGWGLWMTVFMPILGYFVFSESIDLMSFVIGFPIYLIGGFVVAYMIWNMAESKYRNSK